MTSCELARESLMGVRPCQVKVQSASWHCCCQVCPFSVFSKMPQLLRFSLQFDSTNATKAAGFGRVVFFSCPRDPELEDSFKVAGHSGRPEGRREAPVHEGRAPGLRRPQKPLRMARLLLGFVRLRAMYLTQHRAVNLKTNKSCPWVFVLYERTCGTWKLQLCNHGKRRPCDLGRDLCLVSRYCLNQPAVPVDHHTRSLSAPRWRWQSDRLPLTLHWLPHIRSLLMALNLLESDAKPKVLVTMWGLTFFFFFFFFLHSFGCQSFGCWLVTHFCYWLQLL